MRALGVSVEERGTEVSIRGAAWTACTRRRRNWTRATPAPPSACSPASWPRSRSSRASAVTNHSRAGPWAASSNLSPAWAPASSRTRRPLSTAGHPRRKPAAHRLHASGAQRSSENLRTVRRTIRGRRDHGARACTLSRSHGDRPARIRRGLARRIARPSRSAGRPTLIGRDLVVPSDLSSAAFFIVAALLLPGSHLAIRGVGLNPTRSALLDFLAGMGAAIRITEVESHNGELAGELSVAEFVRPRWNDREGNHRRADRRDPGPGDAWARPAMRG